MTRFRNGSEIGNVGVQIAPVGVVLFDQVQLPDAVHLPDRLFSQKCRSGVLVAFEIDQLMNRVLTGDPGYHVALVIEDTIDQVRGYTDVHGAFTLAGEDIGVMAVIHD